MIEEFINSKFSKALKKMKSRRNDECKRNIAQDVLLLLDSYVLAFKNMAFVKP